MDFIEKISLKDSNEKDAILDNDSLSDEQKVVLYNEIFQKQQLQNLPKPKPETARSKKKQNICSICMLKKL